MKALNILLLSSLPADWSANLGKDMMDALIHAGHHVDFGYPEFQNEIDSAKKSNKPSSFFRICKDFHLCWFFYKLGLHFKHQFKEAFSHNCYRVVNGNEKTPLLRPEIIIKGLGDKKYDYIITIFWQSVINSTTLKLLYNHYKCPIFIYAVDMAPMTGGCFYFNKCNNFSDSCRHCPALGGLLFNRAHINYNVKYNNYNTMEVACACNTWSKVYYEQSNLFRHLSLGSIIINENTFHPIDRDKCGLDNVVPKEKSFIIITKYTREVRKGFRYIIESMKCFTEQLTFEEKKKIILLFVGNETDYNTSDFDVDVMHLGFLNMQQLVEAYAFSNTFLCASTDDGGPSMINQSIMCGTPVVSFESGTALDVIKNDISGYKVPMKDSLSFGMAISKLFRMSDEDFLKLRKTTRGMAMKYNSSSAFVNQAENVYKIFRQ